MRGSRLASIDVLSGDAAKSVSPLTLTQVEVEGEIGRRVSLAIKENFLALNFDKDFLDPFRHRRPHNEARKALERVIELGCLIDAAVHMAEYSKDPKAVAHKDYLVEETIKTQDPDGYIGIFLPESDASHLFYDWCVEEVCFLVHGLAENFRCFGHLPSLAAAQKLADYIIGNWSNRPRNLSFSALGVFEAFFGLYELTGHRRYFEFAANEEMGKKGTIKVASLKDWDQGIYPGGWVDFRTKDENSAAKRSFDLCHMYRVFERCVGEFRFNRLAPDARLLRMPMKLYGMLTRREKAGMVVTGAVSRSEGWHENQDGTGELGESCATVYYLWYLDEMMRLEEDLKYGDIMERIIFNTLFAAQDPRGRRIRYFTPFSGKRNYFESDTFCCPNNFRRGMIRLPLHIYYRWRGGVAVNLYTASNACLDLGDSLLLTIRQQTRFPTSGHVMIELMPSRPASFPVFLRIPRWSREAKVRINGEPAGAEIARTWKAGDRITIDMLMRWRLIRGRDLQAGRVAVMRGPVVYCVSRMLNKLPEDMHLRDIMIDPESLGEPVKDEAVRPDGLVCRVKAWSPGCAQQKPPDLELVLSEFPEPTGEEIYFRIPEGTETVDDELMEDLKQL